MGRIELKKKSKRIKIDQIRLQCNEWTKMERNGEKLTVWTDVD